jgi:hypothetical protein
MIPITLHEDIKGPNGEEFERDAEIRWAEPGEWVLNGDDGTARELTGLLMGNMVVLTPKKWKPMDGERCWNFHPCNDGGVEHGKFEDGDCLALHFKTSDDAYAALEPLAKFRREVLGYAQ